MYAAMDLSRAKFDQYKKGKKLLNDVKKARARRQQLYSLPATPNGHEADSEDRPATPRSMTYGAIHRTSSPHSIKSTKSMTSPAESGDANAVGVQADYPAGRPPSGSDDSSTPIVPSSKRGLRSRPTASNDIPKLQQVIDTLRRTRRGSKSRERMFVKDDNFEFDESEIMFLHWLDGEIKKIDDFYQEKEHEAVNRYSVLSQQLDVLKRMRDNHGIPSSLPNSGDQSRGGSVSNAVGALEDAFVMAWGKPVQRIRASWDGLHSAMPAADHQRRARQNPDLMAHPIGTAAGYAEYRVARRRLKQAVLEFYRAMELLKQYRLLNRTGLAKILKKFDKTSGRHLTPEYEQKLNSMYFNQSEVLETTMAETEVGPEEGQRLMFAGSLCEIL